MTNIKELSLEGLKQLLKKWGEPDFHARQIFSWIYKMGVKDFGQMSDLPASLRERLKEKFYLFDLRLDKVFESLDGTKKLILALGDDNIIEAAVIPTLSRVTGCVSTQVGCKFACRFCASGIPEFKRNLASAEILDEVSYLKENSHPQRLTHLVFMGMGEPLDNYDNVIKAIRIINAPEGFNIGARRITISTCGIIPGIKKLSDEGLQIELSVSLHSADDKIRDSLMPVNKKYPLEELIAACRRYIEKTNRQVTFEYILIRGINSDSEAAEKLAKILKGLNCKVNLIPANTIRELNVEPPNKLGILFFKDSLVKRGVNVTLRKQRGQDIDASCGQLRLKYVKK
jgi:23S rRNA (adenine2503-C2)-methyltransferase